MPSKSKKYADGLKGRPEHRKGNELIAYIDTDGSVRLRKTSLTEAEATALAAWLTDVYDPNGAP